MDNKIYSPEVIPDAPFPQSMPTNQAQPQTIQGGITGQQIIQSQPLPLPQNADNVISPRLDTKTKQILAAFTFAPTGALRIGDFRAGRSGEVDIDPNGIIAKDINGDTTFALDGEDGSAVFAGQLASGTLLTGEIVVGNTVIEPAGLRFSAGSIVGNSLQQTNNQSDTDVAGSSFTITNVADVPVLVQITVFAYLSISNPDYPRSGYFASLNLFSITQNSNVMVDMQTPGVPGTFLTGSPFDTQTVRTNAAPVSQSVLLLCNPGANSFKLRYKAVGGGQASIAAYAIDALILGTFNQ